MEDKKKEIKGCKTSEKTYKGKITKIVQGVISTAVALGLTVTAAEAISKFNHWQAQKMLTSMDSSIIQMDKQKIDELNGILENFGEHIENYKYASENGDKNRLEHFDEIVEEEDYIEKICEEIENTIVKQLGYDPEKVEISMGRNGIYLTEGDVVFDFTGDISKASMLKDENGKPVGIPKELRDAITEQTKIISSPSGSGEKAMKLIDILDTLDKLKESEEIESEKIELGEER